MSDQETPLLGYVKLPENLTPRANIPKSRIPKYSPTKARKTQNVDEQNENEDDFPLEKLYICVKCGNVAEPREESPIRNPEPVQIPDPIPITTPTIEPIAEDTAEQEDSKQQSMLMNVMLVLAYILLKPFEILLQYFIRLAKALYAALPILLVAIAIWAYIFEEPVDRIEKAVDELFKDRTEVYSSWF